MGPVQADLMVERLLVNEQGCLKCEKSFDLWYNSKCPHCDPEPGSTLRLEYRGFESKVLTTTQGRNNEAIPQNTNTI